MDEPFFIDESKRIIDRPDYCPACGKIIDVNCECEDETMNTEQVIEATDAINQIMALPEHDPVRAFVSDILRRKNEYFSDAANLSEKNEALVSELSAVKAETLCDVCGGAGRPVSGKDCICGGTGKLIDAATGMRLELFDLEAEKEKYREALERIMKLEVYRPPGWTSEGLVNARGIAREALAQRALEAVRDEKGEVK